MILSSNFKNLDFNELGSVNGGIDPKMIMRAMEFISGMDALDSVFRGLKDGFNGVPKSK